jgi:hypothetical protein
MNLIDRAAPCVFSAISLSLVAVLLLVVSQPWAKAQTNYPNRTVRIVVPFAAGGVADTTARIVAEKLTDKLGQRFYIETARRRRHSRGEDGDFFSARWLYAGDADQWNRGQRIAV